MSQERIRLALAGSLILISLGLAHWHSGYWLWLTAFVGANLLQLAFIGYCPLTGFLKKLGCKPNCEI